MVVIIDIPDEHARGVGITDAHSVMVMLFPGTRHDCMAQTPASATGVGLPDSIRHSRLDTTVTVMR